MISIAELRAEWVRQQREPVDQYWTGPAPFVERLLELVAAQQESITQLRRVLAPFLSDTRTCGLLQIEAARACWLATGPDPHAAPDWTAIALRREATEPWSAAPPS